MNPFVELLQAGALFMLLFAAVLLGAAIRNVEGPRTRARVGPVVIGVALLLFAIPIYASVAGTTWFDDHAQIARIIAAMLLPVGLFMLTALKQPRDAPPGDDDA